MSLLAPLYALGALAIAAPIIFHLIRRRTRERTPISSVMFLPATKPRLRRRSRVEHWPLLLLRALALIALAIAFSRPFVRTAASDTAEGASRRVIALVDTSASMRRDDLWQQALGHLRDVTGDLAPGDTLAVIAFDAEPVLRLDFDAAGELRHDALRGIGDRLFAGEVPSWRATDLGAALRFAADHAAAESGRTPAAGNGDDAPADEPPATTQTQVVLISDMQAGADLESLQGFAWPQSLPLEIRRVTSAQRTNAWLTLPRTLADAFERTEPQQAASQSDTSEKPTPDVATDGRQFRLRVTNSSDSTRSQFRIAWQDESKVHDDTAMTVQVPPGQSRVVRIARPPQGARAVELSGDDHDFDNVRYYADQPPREVSLLFIGPDSEEPRESLGYYLERLSLDTHARKVSFRRLSPEDALPPEIDPREVPLTVVAGQVDDAAARLYRSYVERGGRLVYVPPPAGDAETEASVRRMMDSQTARVSEAEVSDYAMWSRIDFSHPLFVPLAGPQFNDFSRIRFWAHRVFSELPEQWTVPVRLDSGAPAILEHARGDGRLWIFASGWQPVESQLALSTKFIPLMFGLFESPGGTADVARQFFVGERFPRSDGDGGEIVRLGESAMQSAESIDADVIEAPGVYRIGGGDNATLIAANLPDAESRTEPMGDDELERLGIVLKKASPRAEQAAEVERQLRDVELEGQQRLWRWLLIGVLGMLGIETLLSGYLSRRSAA